MAAKQRHVRPAAHRAVAPLKTRGPRADRRQPIAAPRQHRDAPPSVAVSPKFSAPVVVRSPSSSLTDRRSGVDNSQLRALAPAPTIERQRADEMHEPAARLAQRFAERLAGGAERDCVDADAVYRRRAQPDVVGSDGKRLQQAKARERKHRLGISGAERPRRFDGADEIRRRGAHGERGVDGERGIGARGRDRRREPLFKESAQLAEFLAADRHTGGHRMAAALDRDALFDRDAHDAADIDPYDRTRRADRVGVPERKRERGPAEALLEPRRDEPNDPLRPALSGNDNDGAALLESERGERFGFCLGERCDFDLLARAIEAIELRGDFFRARFVAGNFRAIADNIARYPL